MHAANTWFICITALAGVVAISYWTAQSSIEADKQEAFMMKACVDAGGEWSKSWNRIPSCLRPGNHS